MSKVKIQIDNFLKAVEEVYETPCRVVGIQATALYLTDMKNTCPILYCCVNKPWKEVVEKKNQTGFRGQRFPISLAYDKAVPLVSVEGDISFGLFSSEVLKRNFPTDLDISYGLDGFSISEKSHELLEKRCFGLTEDKPELVSFFTPFKSIFKELGDWTLFEDAKKEKAAEKVAEDTTRKTKVKLKAAVRGGALDLGDLLRPWEI